MEIHTDGHFPWMIIAFALAGLVLAAAIFIIARGMIRKRRADEFVGDWQTEPPAGLAREVDAYLVIPDISGYTRFMHRNHLSLEHAQRSVSKLLASLAEAAGPFLTAGKLEGDAILLHREVKSGSAREEVRLAGSLKGMLDAFYQARDELVQDPVSTECPGCAHVADLDIKIVVHKGRVLIHQLLGREELSGPAVILAHRLLKSAYATSGRILATQATTSGRRLPFPAISAPTSVTIEELGTIDIAVYDVAGRGGGVQTA